MKQFVLAAALAALAATPAIAQEGFAPPADGLKHFAAMVGDWEGGGHAVMQPGMEPMPWTGTSHCEWILGGHCLQEDMKIEFGEGVPVPPLHFRTFYAWDKAHNRPVAYEASNMGGSVDSTLRWLEPGVLVTVSHSVEEGVPVVDRWVTEFSDNSYTLRGDRAMGTMAPFTHVEGEMKRSSTSYKGVAMQASAAFSPVPDSMKHLKAVAGTYEFKGKALLDPNMPAMTVQGKEHMDWVMGNHVLASHITGAAEGMPGSYEAFGAMYWDSDEDCIQGFYVDNMGDNGTHKGWVVEPGVVVFASASPQGGIPGAERMVLRYSTENGMESTVSHRMNAAGAAVKTFEGNYRKAE